MLNDFKYWRDSNLLQVVARPSLRWIAHILVVSGLLLSGSEDYWVIPVGRSIYNVTNLPAGLIMTAVGVIPMVFLFGAAGLYLASWYRK